MQRRRLNISFRWNAVTAIAAFLLTAVVNVAAAAPSGETRLNSSPAKQLEAAAGLLREALTAHPAKLDGGSGDGDADAAIVTARLVAGDVGVLLPASLPVDSSFARQPLALRAGLTRAPPSL
jgi:hypothetical protein